MCNRTVQIESLAQATREARSIMSASFWFDSVHEKRFTSLYFAKILGSSARDSQLNRASARIPRKKKRDRNALGLMRLEELVTFWRYAILRYVGLGCLMGDHLDQTPRKNAHEVAKQTQTNAFINTLCRFSTVSLSIPFYSSSLS